MKVKPFADGRSVAMRVYFKLVPLCAAFSLQGCLTTHDSVNDLMGDCDEIGQSLKADTDTSLNLGIKNFGFGLKRSVDYANDLTEERQVAVLAMRDACRKYARGLFGQDAEDPEESYEQHMMRLGGAFLASKQIEDTNAVLASLQIDVKNLDGVFKKMGIELSPEQVRSLEANAKQFLNSADVAEQVRQTLEAAIQENGLEPDSLLEIASILQELERNLELESELKLLQAKIDRFEQENGAINDQVSRFLGGFEFDSAPTALSVYFDFDSATLDAASRRLLDTIASDYRGVASAAVIAYADSVGDADYNLALAERRANSVAEYLQDNGFEVRFTSGAGSTRVFGDNESNRMAVILLSPFRATSADAN